MIDPTALHTLCLLLRTSGHTQLLRTLLTIQAGTPPSHPRPSGYLSKAEWIFLDAAKLLTWTRASAPAQLTDWGRQVLDGCRALGEMDGLDESACLTALAALRDGDPPASAVLAQAQTNPLSVWGALYESGRIGLRLDRDGAWSATLSSAGREYLYAAGLRTQSTDPEKATGGASGVVDSGPPATTEDHP